MNHNAENAQPLENIATLPFNFFPQNTFLAMFAPTFVDAQALSPMIVNNDGKGDSPIIPPEKMKKDYCCVQCPCKSPYHGQLSFPCLCFFLLRTSVLKNLPTLEIKGFTYIRFDQSWHGHYMEKSHIWKLYHEINNHSKSCHEVSLPPLPSSQSTGNNLLSCPFNQGTKCEKCTGDSCNGVFYLAAETKPITSAIYDKVRYFAPSECSNVVLDLLDDDYKGESEKEKSSNKSQAKEKLKQHIKDCHSNAWKCKCTECISPKQMQAYRNSIAAASRPTRLGAPANGSSYGQPQQHPTVDITAEWEGSIGSDSNANDFVYRDEGEFEEGAGDIVNFAQL
jgi:hypothetical protein